MLQRFIALIDRLSDRLYPVTVLEWRREFRQNGRGIFYAGICCCVAVFAAAGLVFESEVWDIFLSGSTKDRLFWIFISPYLYLLGFGAFINLLTTTARPFVWRDVYKTTMPDYYLAPMDRDSIFIGCCQWWLLRMVSLYLHLLPCFVFAWALRILPFSWVLFYPAVFWTLFFTLGNMFIPLLAFAVHPQKKRPWWKELFMGLIGGLAGAAFVGIPCIFIFLLCLVFWEVHVARRPLSNFDGIVDFRYWFPMFLVGVTTFNAAVWPLARLVMRKDGTGPKKLLAIYVLYLLIALSLAGLWFALWFVFR